MQTSEPVDLRFFRLAILSSEQKAGVVPRLYPEVLATPSNLPAQSAENTPDSPPGHPCVENPNDRLAVLVYEIRVYREQGKPVPHDVVDEAENIIVGLTAHDSVETEFTEDIKELAPIIARIRARNEEEFFEDALRRLLGRFAPDKPLSTKQTLGTAAAIAGVVLVSYTYHVFV
jgi:hypothetical protein